MAKYAYGIDLGTTYSCIAYVDEAERPNVIKNLEGTNTTPSVVNFPNPNEVVVGQVAKDSSITEPEKTISFVKTLMGKTKIAINCNGKDKTPEEVSSYILRKLAEDAAKMIDAEVKDVVITCPAYFGSAEREATKIAGELAGLNVLEIISEPVAAAIYYGCTREHEKKTVLVYDLGGGTFDVTIAKINPEINPKEIEIIRFDGDHNLGGKDWDDATMRYLAGEYSSRKGYDVDFDKSSEQDLRLKAEVAKQRLTSRESVPVWVEVNGDKEEITLSRETFDEITAPLLNSTIDKTDATISVAEQQGFKIDEILLVGGSTRMPQVSRVLEEKYGIKPKILEPDEAVAKGAAIHAFNVYITNNDQILFKWPDFTPNTTPDPTPKKQTKTIGPVIKSVATKSYAIKAIVDDKTKCYNMIFKNKPMPNGVITVSDKFGTAEANQETAEIVVYESDIEEKDFDVDKDYEIGNAILELPGNLPAESPIEITLSLNREGILIVTGKDLTSNKEIQATMQSKNILTDKEIRDLKDISDQLVLM